MRCAAEWSRGLFGDGWCPHTSKEEELAAGDAQDDMTSFEVALLWWLLQSKDHSLQFPGTLLPPPAASNPWNYRVCATAWCLSPELCTLTHPGREIQSHRTEAGEPSLHSGTV